MSIARLGAGAVGVGYILAGVVGFFVTGFDGFVANTDEALIGFDLNPFHNIVHLVIGGGLLAVAVFPPQAAIAEGALIGGGLVYLLAAFLGFVNHLQILSINDPLAADNFLHLVSGSAALLIGMLGALQARASLRSG